MKSFKFYLYSILIIFSLVILTISIQQNAYGQSDPSNNNKKPVVLTIDGMCISATANVITWSTCYTNYLQESLAPKLSAYLVTTFQWTGDTKDTDTTVKYAEKFIKGYYEVAKNRGTTFEIIAHSWGTVLSYIVLKRNPDIKVDTFITLGSPLNSQTLEILAYTIDKIEHNNACNYIQKMPSVKRWINYWAFHDLVSGPIALSDKNVQIDEKVSQSSFGDRVVATIGVFHSEYYKSEPWKSMVTDDLLHRDTVQESTEVNLSVQVSGDPCPCGSHGGGFEATYDTRKISIEFSHSPNTSNPVEHPIMVFKNNEPFKDWYSLLCSIGSGKCPIAGSKITVSGQWKNKTSFEAYKIWIK
jgi:hypothetical protein